MISEEEEEEGEEQTLWLLQNHQEMTTSGGSEVDSGPSRKVHDAEKLGVEIPETAHQISTGSISYIISFFSA